MNTVNQEQDIDYSKETFIVVDDEDVIRDTIKKLLTALGFSVDTAESGPEALQRLEDHDYSFMLTDMKMPEMDGLDIIKEARSAFPNLSIVAMTGYASYDYVNVINAGANDFIKKPFDIEELEAKVRRIIYERNLKEELSRLSVTDSLTGLFNHRHFYEKLKLEVTRARRQRHSLALIFIDLDNFKRFNDTHGHLAGDELLRDVGTIINNSIREGVDSGFRYGGDEFSVILIDADEEITHVIGQRIRDSFQEHGSITASMGAAIFREGMSIKELVDLADQNLYQAKTERKKENDI